MKQKPHTPFITALLKKTLGEEADTAALPVFEVVATSSRALKKKGLYDKAVITPLTLAQMAAWVNREAIPFMQDHNMEGSPKGKFFYAEMMQDSGVPELRGMFYLDPTETELISKANTGTMDEVSVGFLPSSIKCSACKWDYMAALRAGNYEPLLSLTCENGHKLNKDGVHALVDGLEDFMELSAVSRGAAPNSKIIGNDNAKLGEHIHKLAASGFDVNDLYLTASVSEGEDEVDLTELVTQLSATKAESIALQARAETAETSVTALTARADTAEARVTELEAELSAAKEATAPTEDAAALEAAQSFLAEQFKAVLNASGKTDEVEVPGTVAELIAGINDHRARLSAILPIGGVAASANHQEDKGDNADEARRIATFKTKN